MGKILKDIFYNAAHLFGGKTDLDRQKDLMKQQQKYTEKNQQFQLQANSQLQQEASDLQLRNSTDLFNMQNQRQDEMLVNGKQMEMQGLRNAGINPAFQGASPITAMGSPSAPSPGSSVGLASAPAGAALPSDNVDPLAFSRSIQDQILQKRIADADIDNTEANTISTLSLIDPQKAKLIAGAKLDEQLTTESERRAVKIDAETENVQASTKQIRAATDRIRALTPHEVDNLIANTDYLDAQQQAISAKLPFELQQLEAGVLEIAARTNMYSEQASMFVASVNKIGEEVKLLKKQGVLTDNNANLVLFESAKAIAEGDKTAYENKIRQGMGEGWNKFITAGSDFIGLVGECAGIFGKVAAGYGSIKNAGSNQRNATTNERNASTNEKRAQYPRRRR